MFRMTIDVYFFRLLILKVFVLRVKEIYIPFFNCGQKSAIMLSKGSEIGQMAIHCDRNFRLIKNQVRTQDQK